MNKGFLMFADDETGLTMLKDEPDDLTHLAPTAGDACIPLEDSAPFFTDMFDDFMMHDNYSSLLPDEINSLDSQDEQKCLVPNQTTTSSVSSTNSNNSNLSDPFINYRDESSETSCSPHLLSPSGLEKSPDANSMPSLSSPDGSLPEEDIAFMTLNMNDEMDLRAPYIPMTEADDLPLLISDDLMWGAHPETVNLAKELKNTLMNNAISSMVASVRQHNLESINSNSLTTTSPSSTTQATAGTTTTTSTGIKTNMDSSLAALLCGQLPSQHQTHQATHRSDLYLESSTVDESKLRLLDHSVEEQIVNPIDVIGQAFKNTEHRIDTWTVQEPKSLNNETVTVIPQTTTIRLSPISITTASSTTSAITPPPSLTITAKKIETNKISHKRPHVVILSEPNKRLKCATSTVTLTPRTMSNVTAPQLLQQLMASSPQKMNQQAHQLRIRIKDQLNAADEEFLSNSSTKLCSPSRTINSSKPIQASNSVLMNLLVSGCDVSAGYTCFPRATKAAKA